MVVALRCLVHQAHIAVQTCQLSRGYPFPVRRMGEDVGDGSEVMEMDGREGACDAEVKQEWGGGWRRNWDRGRGCEKTFGRRRGTVVDKRVKRRRGIGGGGGTESHLSPAATALSNAFVASALVPSLDGGVVQGRGNGRGGVRERGRVGESVRVGMGRVGSG